MSIISSGLTDIGMVRSSNQDAIYLNRELNLFVVADGMGGHKGGDIASAIAVKCIPEYVQQHIEQTPREVLNNSIDFANRAILKKGKDDELLEGMGTTSVVCYFKGDTLYVGNVGDSRAYLINKSNLFQLSIDHSLVQEKLNMSLLADIGDYTRESAENDPQKNVIVRTLGFEEEVSVDVFDYKVNRNDIILTCSDGLHGKVSDEEIASLVNKYIPDPSVATQESVDQLVKSLVQTANDHGGNDNISVIVMLAK